MAAIHAGLDDQLHVKFNETGHLRTARDRGAQTLVYPTGASLFFESFRHRPNLRPTRKSRS